MSDDEDLKQAAADRLEELDALLTEANAELHRIYEITAIFHLVVDAYLDSNPETEDPEEQEALKAIQDARYAVENNTTVDQARLVREEELVE